MTTPVSPQGQGVTELMERLRAHLKQFDHVHGGSTLAPGLVLDDLRTAASLLERYHAALEEAVYAVRNAAGISEWHRLHSSRAFDHQDFSVWAQHWEMMHPVVAEIGRRDDGRARTALGQTGEATDGTA